MHDIDQLVGHIYDAAVEPGRWPQVLENLSDFLEGAATKLTFQNVRTSRSEANSVRMSRRRTAHTHSTITRPMCSYSVSPSYAQGR